MPISIKVKNFCGLARGDLEFSKVALVLGRNGAGKSSLLQAVAAAVSGDPLTRSITVKKAADSLVKDGAEAAVVTVRDTENGYATLRWPTCERETDGRAPFGVPFALGSDSLALVKPEERAKALTTLLPNALPAKEDLARELADVGISEKTIDVVWQEVDLQGWDNALGKVAKSGTEMKGRWGECTGERYGSAKAEGWTPKGWEQDDQLPEDPEDVQDLLQAAEVKLADVNRKAGNTDGAIAEKERRIGELRPVAATLPQLTEERDRLQTELGEVTEKRKAARDPHAETGYSCPHCAEPIMIRKVNSAEMRIEKVTRESRLSPGQIKELADAIAVLDGRKGNIESRVGTLQTEIYAANRAKAEIAKIEQEIEDAKAAGTASQAEVDKATRSVDRLRTYLRGLQQFTQASALATKIANNAKIQEVLKPEGLRQQKLTKALTALNASMAAFCEAAGMAPVTVQDDMTIAYRGRAYGLCSESEKWRARLALQVALAKLGHASIMLVDALDIVEGPARGGIVKALSGIGIPTIVAMTAGSTAPAAAPEIGGKAKLGVSYWIEAGETMLLADAPREKVAA